MLHNYNKDCLQEQDTCAGADYVNQTLMPATFIHKYSCTHKLDVDELCSIFHAVLMLPNK